MISSLPETWGRCRSGARSGPAFQRRRCSRFQNETWRASKIFSMTKQAAITSTSLWEPCVCQVVDLTLGLIAHDFPKTIMNFGLQGCMLGIVQLTQASEAYPLVVRAFHLVGPPNNCCGDGRALGALELQLVHPDTHLCCVRQLVK